MGPCRRAPCSITSTRRAAACWGPAISAFNGDGIQEIAPTNAVLIPFAWLSQAGAEYANVKVVYLSPQIFGIDLGFQYAPSMGNGFANSTGATANITLPADRPRN